MSVNLVWSASPDAEGYIVYRATSPFSAGALPAPLASVTAPTTTFEDTATVAGATYYYRVAAYAGASEAVGELVAVTDSPSESRIALAENDLAFSMPDNLLLSGDAQAGADLLLL